MLAKNSMKKISAIHPAITENKEKMLLKHVPKTSLRESHNASISAMSDLFQNIVSYRLTMRSASVIFMFRTEAIMCLLQIVTLRGCEQRMGDQRGTKAAL